MLDLSCRDWEARIRSERSLVPAAAHGINPEEAKRAIGIFDRLRLPDVIGTPTLAEAAGPWFREIVGVFLGSIDPATGARLIREMFVLAAKKSSKTSYGAAMMLTALLMNKRPRAEFLFIAPTLAVADLAFSQAAGMIALDDEGFLQKRMHLQDHLKIITDRRTKAQLKIKTFDTSVLTGVKPAGVLLDELHEIARNAKALRIIGQIRGGLLPIQEAFLAFISTQSDEIPSGAFKAELMMARAIRDGRATGAMMPVLYEFPLDIVRDKGEPPAWQDSRLWRMVTPNVERSITIARLEADFEAAKLKGDEEIRRWASQHLNLEMGIALHSDAWPAADFWEQCAVPDLSLDALLERSEVVVAGIDTGGLNDLASVGVLGRDRQTREWLYWSHSWAHEKVLERYKIEAPRYRDFEAAGELTIFSEWGADVGELCDIVEKVRDSGLLPSKASIGVDPYGIGQIVDELAARGIGQEQIVGVGQGWRLAPSVRTVERKVADRTLLHAGQNLMAWCVGNCRLEMRGNAASITKAQAGVAKVDPVMALLNCVALMSQNPQSARSIYDQMDDATAAELTASPSDENDDDESVPPWVRRIA